MPKLDGFADRLRVARTRMRPEIMQKDAAKAVNRSAPCYGYWESGKSEPTLHDLVLLADLYKVSVDWLLGLDSRNSQAFEAGLLDAASAGDTAVPMFPTEAITGQTQPPAAPQYINSSRKYGKGQAFAWAVETDAIARCSNGDVAIIEREYDAEHNGIYLIVADTGLTLRRCKRDGGQAFFVPDAQGFPIYNSGEVRLVGRVREIIKRVTLE